MSSSQAQIVDTTKVNLAITSKLTNKKFILPVSLIVAGTLLRKSKINQEVYNYRNRNFYKFYDKTDDFLQYAPIALSYSGNLLGFKSKNSYNQMIINQLVSNIINTGTVFALKETFKDYRPDNTGRNSFPSGHTTTSFNNATLHFLEYKDSNLWFAYSGYLFASTTGIFRVLNNRHYLSDITAGAGLGIATAIIVHNWNPFKVNRNSNVIPYPYMSDNSYGLGLVYNFK